MKHSSVAIACCIAAAALFGASTPAAKVLLQEYPPLLLSGLLYLGAAIATLPSLLRAPLALLRLNAHNRRQLLISIVFGGVIGPLLLFLGLQLASAASVSVWLVLETVATTLIAWRWYGEHIERFTLAALLLLVTASLLLASVEPAAPLAILCVALACIAWGMDNNATAVIDGLTPGQMTFAKGLVGGCTSVGIWLAVTTIDAQSALPVFDFRYLLAALALGGASYGLSITLYVIGAQQLGASRSQLLFSSAPLWGVIIAWTWLGEALTVSHISALLLTVAAFALIQRAKHLHPHVHQALAHSHWHRHDDDHHAHEHLEAVPQLFGWHQHAHAHAPVQHAHPHLPDLHHRHTHGQDEEHTH